MKKHMVLIYPQGDSIFNLPQEGQQAHTQKVGNYLRHLEEKGYLQDAQPLQPFGTILHGNSAEFSVETVENPEIAGFYILQTKEQDDLIAILKEDPRFEDASWKLEIREIIDMM